jgi:hypothetical protein
MVDLLDEMKPEYREAWERTEGFRDLPEILFAASGSVSLSAPYAGVEDEWNHRSLRPACMIGGLGIEAFENDAVPENTDLTDARFVGFFKQSVKNKKTGEIKQFFATVPLDCCGEAIPGLSFHVTKGIPLDWKREEVEAMAKESFLKLQQLAVEYAEMVP